jgi:membrane-associated phospholipid phosphatase
MANPSPAGRRLAILFGCVALVVLCVLFVDRAASTWSFQHLHSRRPLFYPLTHIVDPLHFGPAIVLILAGIAWCAGWRPGSVSRVLLELCVTLIVAYAVKEFVKYACGRTWPETWVANNPSWIKDGDFSFHPFHGKEGWASFPSGHTTMICAFATFLWQRARPLRWVGVGLAVLVVIGLLGCDYHYVGDMLAGAFLGTASASAVIALLRPAQA